MENIRSTILTYLNTNSIENLCFFVFAFVFFTISVFFHEHSRITGLQGKGECISLTPHYHFQPLHRHLNISRAIAAESSPLHIVNSRTRTANHQATRPFGDMKNIIAGINNIDVISEIETDEPLHARQFSETSVHSCPYKEVF